MQVNKPRPRLHGALRSELDCVPEDSRPALDPRTAAGQDDIGGVGVEVGPKAAAYDAPIPVRQGARQVAAERLTDRPPSVALPEDKVPHRSGPGDELVTDHVQPMGCENGAGL